MVKSFLLLKTQSLSEGEAIRKLNKIPEILNINPLFGKEYNLMIEIESKKRSLKDIIEKEIEKIPGMSVMKILNGC